MSAKADPSQSRHYVCKRFTGTFGMSGSDSIYTTVGKEGGRGGEGRRRRDDHFHIMTCANAGEQT